MIRNAPAILIPVAAALLAGLTSLGVVTATAEDDKPPRVFELRTYFTDNEAMAKALHERFRDHTCALFKRHGMELIGFWIPREEQTKLVYLLAFPSKEAADASWKAFQDDPEWKKVAEESHQKAGGKIVSKVERSFLDPTDYSPMK